MYFFYATGSPPPGWVCFIRIKRGGNEGRKCRDPCHLVILSSRVFRTIAYQAEAEKVKLNKTLFLVFFFFYILFESLQFIGKLDSGLVQFSQ